MLKVSKKNFEVPTRSSLPGFTAIHDSDRFELYAPGLHVPGSGLVCPGGTGYPPPCVGELATAFVPTNAHGSAWAVVVTAAASRSVPIEIDASALFTIVPPFDSRSCVGENRLCPQHGTSEPRSSDSGLPGARPARARRVTVNIAGRGG